MSKYEEADANLDKSLSLNEERIKELIHRHPLPLSAKGYAHLIQQAVHKEYADTPQKGMVCLRNFHVTLTPEQQQKKKSILKQIKESKLEGLPISTFNHEALIPLLLSQQSLVRIGTQLIAQDSITELVSKLTQYFKKNKILSPVAFKDMSDLSRKYAIPMLEWLDTQGYTLRTEKGRIQRERS